jgi:hypothetical protein
MSGPIGRTEENIGTVGYFRHFARSHHSFSLPFYPSEHRAQPSLFCFRTNGIPCVTSCFQGFAQLTYRAERLFS